MALITQSQVTIPATGWTSAGNTGAAEITVLRGAVWVRYAVSDPGAGVTGGTVLGAADGTMPRSDANVWLRAINDTADVVVSR